MWNCLPYFENKNVQIEEIKIKSISRVKGLDCRENSLPDGKLQSHPKTLMLLYTYIRIYVYR